MTNAKSCDVHHMNSGFPGARSPARLIHLLRLIACNHVQGVSIRELTNLSTLDRTTTRRLLMVLVQTGFASKDGSSGRYRLGVEAMLTGMASMAKPPIFEACHPVMMNIARRTGNTVFLVIRIGDFAHCLHVEAGSNPLSAHTLMTGQIRLLGQGTASLALAATLRDRELDQTYERRSLDYEAAGISQERLRDMVKRTRKAGYSESINLLTSGAAGVGIAITLQTNHIAAMSVASYDSAMSTSHRDEILIIFNEELERAGLRMHSGT